MDYGKEGKKEGGKMRIPKYMSVLAVLILLGASFVPVCIGKMTTSEPKKNRVKMIRVEPVTIPVGTLWIKWNGSFWTAWMKEPEIIFEPHPENEIWKNVTIYPNTEVLFTVSATLTYIKEIPLPPQVPPNGTLLKKIFDSIFFLYGCRVGLSVYTKGGILLKRDNEPANAPMGELPVHIDNITVQEPTCPFNQTYKAKVEASTWFYPSDTFGPKYCTVHFCVEEKKVDAYPTANTRSDDVPTRKSVQNVKQSMQNIEYVNLYCGYASIKWKTPFFPTVEANLKDTELTVNLSEENATIAWIFTYGLNFEPHNLPIIPAIGFYTVSSSLLEGERIVLKCSDRIYSYKWGSSEYHKGGISVGVITSQVHRNDTFVWKTEIRAVAIPIYKSVVAHGEIVVHFV